MNTNMKLTSNGPVKCDFDTVSALRGTKMINMI